MADLQERIVTEYSINIYAFIHVETITYINKYVNRIKTNIEKGMHRNEYIVM